MHQIRIGIKQATIALGDKDRLVGFCCFKDKISIPCIRPSFWLYKSSS